MLTESRGKPKIPVTLIAGFLGAGKTTLLNHILSGDHGVRAAVLVNDFGSINIDAKLIVGVEGDTVNLANGCVCCTIRDDLVGACLGLLRRPEAPEHLLIELSGVSDPVPVLNTFLETQLAHVFSFNSILSVVDAEQLPQLEGEMARLARGQIGVADVVVLNKTDLVSADELARVKQLVQLVTPGSRIFEAVQGRVPLELVLEGGREDQQPRPKQDQHGEHAHDHGFASWSWTSDRALSLPRLRSVLEQLPETVYRCKGVVQMEEMPLNRYVLQMVGKRYHFEETGRWDDEVPFSEIVLIGGRSGIAPDELQSAFDACIGTGDASRSPVLRLVRRLAPELLSTGRGDLEEPADGSPVSPAAADAREHK
ncbi:MAG: GTP-binding protein [Polyangiales bacterium]